MCIRDSNITEELRRWGRAGVPLVLVFPSDKTKQPKLLPELLSADTVLTSLNEATD